MALETVKVKNGDGYMIINKSDFDESKHELFESKPKSAPKKTTRKPKAEPKAE